MNYSKSITYKAAFLFSGLLAAYVFFFAGTVFAAGPQILTLPATATQTSLTLNGNFTGGTGTTQVRFQYGTTPLMSSGFTAYQNFTASNGSFTETLTGLTPGTTYYFRAEGINSNGPGFGNTLNKTTLAYAPPQIQTLPPSSVTSTTANAGFWYQSDTAATVTIEYANNNQYIGSYTSQVVSKPAGNGSDSVALTGLTPNTTYYYHAKITNSGGSKTATSTLSFTTTASGGTGTGTTGGSTGGTTGSGTQCTLSQFYASPSTVYSGSSTTLYWTTSNCSYVVLSGPNVGGTYTTGTNSVSTGALYSVSNYSITAYGSNGTTMSSNLSVSLNTVIIPNNTCQITNFYASPSQVTLGNSTTLFWNTQNCTSVSVSGPNVNLQNYAAIGSFMVVPTGTGSSYFLTAQGPNGSTQSQVFVGVTNIVYPTPTPYPNPYPVQPTLVACNDGIDNDLDGKIDGNDPGCSSSLDTSEYNSTAVPVPGTTTLVNGTTTYGNLGVTSTVTNSDYRVRNNLAGLALWGGTILPTSLMGILILIIIILAIVLIARKLTANPHDIHEDAGHGHH